MTRRMSGRRRFWRGSATLFAAILLGLLSALFIASWHGAQAVLFQREYERERGRLWGLTCLGAHRAVQAGLVTTGRTVSLNELRRPPAPFRPFLPAGMAPVDEAGVLAAGYGSVLVDGVPMAVCSLTGTGLARNRAELRAGAGMAGMEVVGRVGGTETAMHAHLPDVERVLGALPAGSLFATADFGLSHPLERVHRRAVGGRPELSSMDRELSFDTGRNLVGVNAARVGEAGADSGEVADLTDPGVVDVEVRGDVILRSGDPSNPAKLGMKATTAVTAAGGFAFGNVQRVFTIPGELGIGTSMRSRGAVSAERMTLSEDLEAGGNVDASGSLTGETVDVTGEASAESGAILPGPLRVDSCDGCVSPGLGP